MATWRDGPEYAPVERPSSFATPDAAPLSAAPVPPPPPALPPQPPADYGNPPDAVPLDRLAAAPADTRDPRMQFDVVSTPLTALAPTAPLVAPSAAPVTTAPAPVAAPWVAGQPQSAWGSIHATAPQQPQPWEPAQPIQLPAAPPPAAFPAPPPPHPPPALNQSAFPTSGPWYPPPPPPPARPSSTVGDIARAVTPGLIIALSVGLLIHPLALPLLLVAHGLATRVHYHRMRVHWTFVVTECVIAFLGGLSMYADYGVADVSLWWSSASTWAQLGNLALLVIVPLIVAQGLRRSER